MSITIEEFLKLPERRFPPIVEYISKRFGSKEKFLSFISERKGLKFRKEPYGRLIAEINSRIGKQSFLSLLGICDEKEAELRAYLFDALYKGLIEAVWAHQLSPLYEEITGKKVRISRKTDKKDPAHEIAFRSDEKVFTQAWINLYRKEVLPVTFHYGRLTVGSLGWLKAYYDRWGGQSTIFSIVSERFDRSSQDVIYGNLVSVLKQVAANPEKFDIEDELREQLAESLARSLSEKDEVLYSMAITQLVETYLDDASLCSIINALIAEEHVKSPKVRGLYERFPYTFSDWIITPYGVFKQVESWLRNPVKELADLLQSKLDLRYLQPELEPYHGDENLRLLEYCLRENPEEILRKTGVIRLRRIAEELGISAAPKIKDENDLIRLVTLNLGFNLPPILHGLRELEHLLDSCVSRLRKGESISGVMADVYGGIETLLRDMSYFYICHLWRIAVRNKGPEEVESEVSMVVRSLNVSEKPFSKLTFGELAKLLRTLNKKVRKDEERERRLSETFDRNYIIPQSQIRILDGISKNRVHLFAHKRPMARTDIKKCGGIVRKLNAFCKILREKEIYPHLIRITRQVTNEYGTRYFEAIEENGNEWILEHRWGLDPSKPYLMYSKTSPVAIDPLIIEKIF